MKKITSLFSMLTVIATLQVINVQHDSDYTEITKHGPEHVILKDMA